MAQDSIDVKRARGIETMTRDELIQLCQQLGVEYDNTKSQIEALEAFASGVRALVARWSQ